MDRQRIEELIEILKASTAAEISCQEGDSLIRIRRGSGEGEVRVETASVGVSDMPVAQSEAPIDNVGTVPIETKLVGIFHQKRAGDAEPIITPGAQVTEGQVVGAVEALGKWANMVSPVAGQVVEIVAEEDAPVQYGDVLMLIRPQEVDQPNE